MLCNRAKISTFQLMNQVNMSQKATMYTIVAKTFGPILFSHPQEDSYYLYVVTNVACTRIFSM